MQRLLTTMTNAKKDLEIQEAHLSTENKNLKEDYNTLFEDYNKIKRENTEWRLKVET